MNEEELIGGQFYHIYNCGINGESIFRESQNYEHFQDLMDAYVLPVSEVFAWVLMPNHLHFSHLEYPWSSYLTCLSVKPTRLKRESVMGWFDNEANFRNQHNETFDFNLVEKWLEL